MKQRQEQIGPGRATVRDVTFLGARGDVLAATLELPVGAPAGYAITAHCFTCSSDTHATARISGALAERGFAILRLDFTGLGRSGADFADTTFTSNVDDLVAAAAWMHENVGEVGLLLGQSFGGAAVIAAASQVPSIRSIVRVGAPSCPDHVRHLFDDARPSELAEPGCTSTSEAVPSCWGRTSRTTSPSSRSWSGCGTCLRHCWCLHAPADQVVGIDNARQIFEAARAPSRSSCSTAPTTRSPTPAAPSSLLT